MTTGVDRAAPGRGEGLPRYSVAGFNQAVGNLLERGFAPRFLIDATVSRPQLKKGHLWLTLVDGEASVSAVVWASQLPRLTFRPEEGDGVTVVGKLNFWAARASLAVQVLDLRPSLSSVLRQFERTLERLAPEGLFEPARKRPLPEAPQAIALLTSVPSSAYADMLRTAAERWPATRLVVLPIPVQGAVEAQICAALEGLLAQAAALGLEAIVLARGGGSREDLAVFDGETLARRLAHCPLPVVTGLGHEDDTTIADLVADYRAATPTAAIVALLPDRPAALLRLQQGRRQLHGLVKLRLKAAALRLTSQRDQLQHWSPARALEARRRDLGQRRQLLEALSPQRLLGRGFCLIRDPNGRLVRSIDQLAPGLAIEAQLADGRADGLITAVAPAAVIPPPPRAPATP
ncbi:exodeoxyribonuclease VII large subunit [Cyanobium sp. Morenito 9A2]|uniref:exodeoxyribonuclease VII large subunit n=1 Tax=Cyanobium sp. Morenito 9A2 TaxID=2823718 RepID=UPI0020CE864C|nr:exodeoxyribonuclease VII large subunit [Cyanobium sp. Morenito 9A2]MCP9849881.1 exodeoxyribonuclease VII large subunit [Cyanobium sp. Morenito 9A2]